MVRLIGAGILSVVLLVSFGLTSAYAEGASSGTVMWSAANQPPSSSQAYSPTAAPHYPDPLPSWVHPNTPRCEQDRLLTDTSPCGAAAYQHRGGISGASDPTIGAMRKRIPPCQMDRLLTDTTPCKE